jgi:hypothetical protein
MHRRSTGDLICRNVRGAEDRGPKPITPTYRPFVSKIKDGAPTQVVYFDRIRKGATKAEIE